MTPSRVAIVLINWNAWRDCIECLSSLYAGDALELGDVFVVDNASTDGSVQHIVDWCMEPYAAGDWAALDGVRHVKAGMSVQCRTWRANGQAAPQAAKRELTLVQAGANLGFAGGNNVGIAAAGLQRYTHFWLLNTDTVVSDGALMHLLARSELDPRVGMVGSTLIYYHAPQMIQALGGGWLDRRSTALRHIGDGDGLQQIPAEGSAVEEQMAYVVGASLLVTREMVANVGPMEEDYFLYFEEIDWALRAAPRFVPAYAPRSRVFHKMGGSSAKVASEFSLNLLYRNRLRFVSRFMPDRLAATRRVLTVEMLRHVVKGRWTSARLVARTLLDSRRLVASAPPRARQDR